MLAIKVFLSLVCISVIQGCSHLVIQEDDDSMAITGKVMARIVLCPITLCLSEAQISDDARRIEWNEKARSPSTTASVRLYPQKGILTIVAGDHTLAVSSTITRLQQMGVRLVERERVERLFAEQRFRLLYTRDQEADFLKIGQMAGAEQVVFVNVEPNPSLNGYGNINGYNPAVLIRGVSVASGEIMWTGQAQSRVTVNNADQYASTLAWWAITRAMCPPERWNDKTACARRSKR